ncbi:MAG TPA: peptide MFS transporter, partial [Sphingomicrobium sp.]
MTQAAAPSNWFGQPRGLTILFLTNMWETFSYYGMRALLVYYMTKELLISQQHSSLIYGTYTSFAYFTPIVGGAIADRYLGKKWAVIIGATTMAAGHFMMAFEPLFYVALATIAVGNGLFLPSLPSQINDLYGPDDPRRGWAYNVYYVGVNVGGFLAPLVCGTLGETYGWHWGFGAAGIGMLTGLVIYLAGQRYLPSPNTPATIVPAHALEQVSGSRRDTFLLLLAVGLAVTVFRGAYEQVGNTVALWIEGV